MVSEGAAVAPARGIYPGRLAELRRSYDAGRRPFPGVHLEMKREDDMPTCSVFDDHWLVFEHVAGEMPDLRACALLAKTARDALLSAWQGDIPETLSGHSADGTPSRLPHLAIVPLPFVGFPYADGGVLGFGLVPPRGSRLLHDTAFQAALRRLSVIDDDAERRLLTLTTKRTTGRDAAFSVGLSPTLEPSRWSLKSDGYTAVARTFATVTPVVLDPHLKETGAGRDQEIAAQLARACRRIGLPDPAEVVADKHAALDGVPSAYPSGRSPAWMRWRVPASIASRQRTHAVIRFPCPVAGPVILGAGRFMGLGLCRPIDGGRR